MMRGRPLGVIRSVASRIRELFQHRRLARELDEEFRLHIELEIEHRMKSGMSPDEARRSALAEFGGLRSRTEDTMDARGFVALGNFARDMRFAVRRLRRTPTFGAGVVAAMAIGVAAAVGVGALVFQVLLRPLPYDHPETLARVLVRTPGLGTNSTESSGGLFVLFRERASSFAALESYYQSEGVSVTDGDRPEHLSAAMISPGALGMIGARPAAGRLFDAADAVAKPSPVLISYDVWMRRFDGDPNITARTIELNRSSRRIAGVLPRGFDFPSPSIGVWYADEVSADRAGLNFRYLNVIGRLRSGATASGAQVELAGLASRLSERFPEVSAEELRASGLAVSVETLKDATVAPVRAELTLLAIMVAVVLLVAASNVATLFLLRAERMNGEVALSRALGASGAALARRFVAEGLAVGIASSLVAWPLVSAMLASKFGLSAAQLPRAHEVASSPGVVIALVSLTVGLGVALGLVGLVRAGDGVIGGRIRECGAGARARGWRWTQRALVVLQVASAMALLFGTGLVGQSLWRLGHVDIGFNPRSATTFDVSLPFSQYPNFDDGAAFDLALLRGIGALPGVQAVTTAMTLPFDADIPSLRRRIVTEGESEPREATARPNVVPVGYFETMGISIRAGRSLAAGDAAAPEPGIVVSASLAQILFARGEAIGKRIRIPDSRGYPVYRVVGVAGDVFGERIQDGVMPTLYFPLLAEAGPRRTAGVAAQDDRRFPYDPNEMRFVVFSDLPASTLMPALRRAVTSIDPKVPVSNVSLLAGIVAGASAHARLMMVLLAIAAGAALLLSAIGVYSVIAYAVGGRTREFGVRLALGATPRQVVVSVLRDSTVLLAAGVAAGVAASFAGSAAIRSVLFEVNPANPAAYAVAIATIVLVSAAAAYIPARTAGRTNPTIALRSD